MEGLSEIKPNSSGAKRQAFHERDQLQLVTPPQNKLSSRLVFKNLNIETNYEQGDSAPT